MSNGLMFFDWLKANPNAKLMLNAVPGGINVSIHFEQGRDNAFGASNVFKDVEASGMTDSRFTNELQYMLVQALDSHKKAEGGKDGE